MHTLLRSCRNKVAEHCISFFVRKSQDNASRFFIHVSQKTYLVFLCKSQNAASRFYYTCFRYSRNDFETLIWV